MDNRPIVKKLLIIENDRDTLDVIVDISEYNGFEVIKSRVKLPLPEIAQINPNIIIIDHLLDDGLGSDLCFAIKTTANIKNIPVILCSASYKVDQLAQDSLADAFIAKPFDLDEFVLLVNRLAL